MGNGDARPAGENPNKEVEELKKQLAGMTLLAEERLSRLKYLQADFENYRRWSEKEKQAIITLANENLIRDLLVILDDFERALPSLDAEQNREGIGMIQKKLVKILAGYGLQPIECIGKKSDPDFHEVLCRERCDREPGTVVSEVGRGYQLKTKVIRPSKVVVAGNTEEQEGENHG